MRVLFFAAALALFPLTSSAQSWLCEAYNQCGNSAMGNRSSSAPAQPTTNSTISINPAAVPTEETIGVEALYFAGSFDLSLVKGLGRVGAAISPSNSEETFFGPPGFEFNDEFLERKIKRTKLPAQKFTLATAFNLYKNKRSGLKRLELNLGVLGKYNKLSNLVTPGGGLAGVAGPLTFGYSAYSDSFVTDEEGYEVQPDIYEVKYTVETYSAGLFLNSVAIDYSELRSYAPFGMDSTVSVVTASLLLKKAILTVSQRKEISNRLAYNYTTDQLEEKREKNETFGGVQILASKHVMVGAFYNYYLLHEISIGLTAFF